MTSQTLAKARCSMCSQLSLNSGKTSRQPCDSYLLDFLLGLREKLDSPEGIDDHFAISIFGQPETIDQVSCTGLTLMHVNVLGGRNEPAADESEQENTNFIPLYDEYVAMEICEILLQRGASPMGNAIYEMRPLHIAIRREWMNVSRLLLDAGANPNLPEKDIYASRPIDIAVINDDTETIQLLHTYGASLIGFKSMFHLAPLAEAFIRGYLDAFKLLLELGARPNLGLDRNTFRSFGTQLFSAGDKGRQRFIQLIYDHGGDVEAEFRIHAMRVEPDGINQHEPRLLFCCDAICIADLDPTIFIKWICKTRTLKELCRLALRRYCFHSFNNGYQRLASLKSQDLLNSHLYSFIMFDRQS